ncbi:hypothetical protein ACH5RR_020122 [Cinchona calisaya]|uniref:non-specific serine/threonine protein kinase n=1 Tax=Cinchona calisaya TaxID=153742 RepID=A0ABD2ZIJ0_9GENT
MFLSGKSRSSTAGEKSFSVDPVPYKTSRISSTEFHYSFEVNPGQKFIRLHFYPASYRGFENSIDFFTVKAGPFTLLQDFSASLTAETLGIKYLVKEFCLNMEEKKKLNITFLPSPIPKSNLNSCAFVNGIEIISMPTGLYYTPDGDLGARVVGQRSRFHGIDNGTALELTHRLNTGGSFISSVEDFGMFRIWSEDTNYLLQSGVHRVNHQAHRIKYAHMPAFVAPPKLYQTSWKIEGNIKVNQLYNFKWKIPITLGFVYLVRLHFCELDDGMAESEQREFNVVINNHIAETQADVIRWSGGTGNPVYRDYIVEMKRDKGGSKCDLIIAMQSVDELVFGLLNGIEIFKLSNIENSLAAPNPTFPKKVPASWYLRIQKVFLAFGQSNVIVSGMTILIILVNVVVYNLRIVWEEKFNQEKDTQPARTELSCHRFSLVEIKSATQNFSEAFVIGRGGFGKVYKGFIHSISEDVAIKRLSIYSKQGAREFWTEIEMLSRLRHKHLVSLLGYCNEDQEMILVYEYMPCGTLADNLYKLSRKGKDIVPLSWKQRLKICIGAARGMEYLHTGSECAVIHRDVKDSNILLDENFDAKVSDFGLSKLENITQSKSYISTKVIGTPGYWDPEYVMTRRLTRKSDVYSFGIVLLVVLSGKPALDARNQEEPRSLLSWFRECITEGDIDRIVDPSLQGKISSNSLREFLKCIENCLHQLSKKRPTMAQVVVSLEQALEKQVKPMISASRNATVVGQEEVPIHAENAIRSPEEGITNQSIQIPDILTRENDLQLRRTDYTRVPKPSWIWPWKAVWNRGKKQKAGVQLLESKLGGLPLPVHVYSSYTLDKATNNFDPMNMIGDGTSGPVYKGMFNGQKIAVTVRRYSDSRLGIKDFVNEIEVNSRLQHPNIVKLLGFFLGRFVDGEENMLVHEYMQYKSLDSFLFDPTQQYLLDWNRRKIIIEGIGRGLLYLHRDSGLTIIHKNIKPSNILLDGELNPKISDFGFARILEGNQDEAHSTKVEGTIEYLAPEYRMTRKISEKSDVYSYGVLLLEIISGQKITDLMIENAWKLWSENKSMKLVDPALSRSCIEQEIHRYILVALLCVQESADDRPNMYTVLSLLNSQRAELPQPKFLFHNARLDSWRSDSCDEVVPGIEDPEVHLEKLNQFSLLELQIATDNFRNESIISKGSFGEVYKGQLADGSLVAVKRMKEEGGELQFRTEVKMNYIAVHQNILPLYGFCMAPTEVLLVYPYMVNGSVASCLRERPKTQPPLDWPIRKRIALGSARGLAYLNDQCDPEIIHRNIKAANVLLDDQFNALVGGLGFAKLIDYEDTHVTTVVCGTIGHIAPEYLFNGQCSKKTDVFGYGIMLLELITGKRAFELAHLANAEDVVFLDWVKGFLEEKKLETLVDADLQGNYVEDEVEQLIQVALLCTQDSPTKRPKMSQVVKMLESDGLGEIWEAKFQQEFNYARSPNTHLMVADSTSDVGPEELSGPR